MTRYEIGESCDIFFLLNGTLYKMPTAVLVSSNERGFFIAADSRGLRDDGVTTSEQKVFPIRDECARFAFAFSGTVHFTPTDNVADVTFNFNEEAKRIAAELQTVACQNAEDYGDELARRINKRLLLAVTEAQRMGKPVLYPDNEDQFGRGMIAWLFLSGFYNGTRCAAVLRFSHRDQDLRPVQVLHRLPIRDAVVSGPPEVWRMCEATDEKFSRFRLASVDYTPEEMAAIADQYVARCESPEGLDADPKAKSVGGPVLAATVTAKGFDWLRGYGPIPKS